MDSFLKKAQEQAAKLHKEAQARAKDVITQARLDSGNVSGGREMTFARGPLGFTLDVVTVDYVTPGEQAAKLGLQVGARILAVDGYVLPALRKDASPDDRSKLSETVKQWLKDMERPGTLTFVQDESLQPPAAAPTGAAGQISEADRASEDAALAQLVAASSPLATSSITATLPTGEELTSDGAAVPEKTRAEVQRMHDVMIRLQCELELSQAECRELRQLRGDLDDRDDRGAADAEDDDVVGARVAEVAAAVAQSVADATINSLKDQLTATRAELEVARKHALGVSAQLAAEASRAEGLRKALAESENVALDSTAEREQVLEAEVERLRSDIHSMEAENATAIQQAQGGLQHAENRISELEGELAVRATQCTEFAALRATAEREREAAAAERDAARVTAARLRVELEEAEAARQKQAAEHDGVAGRLHHALAELDGWRSRAASQGTPRDVDETDAAPLEAGARAGDAGQEGNMQEHVALLEERCARLQKKLDARPIVYQLPQAGDVEAAADAEPGLALCYESELRSACPLGMAVFELVFKAMDRRLKAMAGRLHASVMVRWVFLAHLLVVYTLASSAWGKTEASTVNQTIMPR